MCFKARNVDIEKPGVIFCVAAVLEGLAMVAYGTVLVVEEQASGDVVEASYLMGMAVFLTTAFVYFALDAVVGENFKRSKAGKYEKKRRVSSSDGERKPKERLERERQKNGIECLRPGGEKRL